MEENKGFMIPVKGSLLQQKAWCQPLYSSVASPQTKGPVSDKHSPWRTNRKLYTPNAGSHTCLLFTQQKRDPKLPASAVQGLGKPGEGKEEDSWLLDKLPEA